MEDYKIKKEDSELLRLCLYDSFDNLGARIIKAKEELKEMEIRFEKLMKLGKKQW